MSPEELYEIPRIFDPFIEDRKRNKDINISHLFSSPLHNSRFVFVFERESKCFVHHKNTMSNSYVKILLLISKLSASSLTNLSKSQIPKSPKKFNKDSSNRKQEDKWGWYLKQQDTNFLFRYIFVRTKPWRRTSDILLDIYILCTDILIRLYEYLLTLRPSDQRLFSLSLPCVLFITLYTNKNASFMSSIKYSF